MKAWFSLTLVCWALVCMLLSVSQQAGLNYPLQAVGSGPWLDRCKEPVPGSPTAAVLRSMEFDQARAAPPESFVLDCAWVVGNMGSPGQEIHGPPQAMGPWRVAGRGRQLKATIKSLFSTKLLARPTEFEE
jgi:hypothetical protein